MKSWSPDCAETEIDFGFGAVGPKDRKSDGGAADQVRNAGGQEAVESGAVLCAEPLRDERREWKAHEVGHGRPEYQRGRLVRVANHSFG
jgi:hypothetical protein